MRFIIRNEYKDALLRLGIGDIGELLKRAEVRVIDDVDKSVVVSLPLECPDGWERIVVKRYDKRPLIKRVEDIFRISKVMREWRMGNRLWDKGIPVAFPLAMGERRRWLVLEDSLLISREIEEARQLRLYIFTLKPPLTAEVLREKRDVLASLARMLREVHEKGFFHGDLNASHILIQTGENGCPGFYFVDFEGSRLEGRLSLRRRIKDLARLNESMPPFISKSDRGRFFRIYSEGWELTGEKRKKLMVSIEARTRAKECK